VVVADDAPGTATVTLHSQAVVSGPATLAVTATPIAATEAKPFSGPAASFTSSDPSQVAADFTATIDWGDGATSPGTISGTAAGFTVTGDHTYADEGTFPTRVTILDATSGPTGSGASTATVAEADAFSGIGSSFTATQGTAFTKNLATFTDANTHNTAGDLPATIDWGDSTSSTGAVTGSAGTFAVTGSHAYGSVGTFTVTITLHDDVSGVVKLTVTVVAATSPTPAGSGGSTTPTTTSPTTTSPTTGTPQLLAFTGGNQARPLGLAVILIVLGSGTLVASRFRRCVPKHRTSRRRRGPRSSGNAGR
jgi:hypothetical protein